MPKKIQTGEFTKNTWGGKVHYQCSACPFDTFDGSEMLEHLVNAHDSEAALEQLLSEENDNGKNNPGEVNG